MSVSGTAITRRGALAVGAGAVVGGLGLTRAAQAAPESQPVTLTTAQLAGQRVIFSYPGATPPASWPNAPRGGAELPTRTQNGRKELTHIFHYV